MKINATEVGRIFGRQTRAYAEYRIFSSLARCADMVREVSVWLTPEPHGGMVGCSVVVGLESGVPVRVSTRGRHAYDAINRAAYRLGRTVGRRR